jgi:hypothetical protein
VTSASGGQRSIQLSYGRKTAGNSPPLPVEWYGRCRLDGAAGCQLSSNSCPHPMLKKDT